MGRQLSDSSGVETINFPQKIYAKLDYFRLAFPFDLTLKRTDITIFPNYALWPTIKSKKRVVTIHDLSFLKFPEVVEVKNLTYLKRVVPHAVRKADLVLTVSHTMKQELVDAYGIPESKIHVTPIPPAEAHLSPSSLNVHQKYSIPTKGYILFASIIEPRKNLDVLLDAYSLLPKNIQESYSLVVAGGMGWNSDDIEQKLTKMQKQYATIVRTGYYDNLTDAPALYQNASVFVMPSLYEGFGMPVLEAMAGKTPVIASDIPVLREVGGDASLHFPTNDPGALAKQLERILTDKAFAKKQVVLGTENLKRFSWQQVAKDLYEKLHTI